MISAKKLIKFARKWQKLAAISRKRFTLQYTIETTNTSTCSTAAKAEKGCFVVYSADRKRFQLPLEYLNNGIIRELFNMAEEELGLQCSGPLTIPCDSKLMDYAVTLIKQEVTADIERALLTSIASWSCSLSSFHLQHQVTGPQLPICSF